MSPGARGNNPLGANDGTGHPLNPRTGLPYAPHTVTRGDFGRVLASSGRTGRSSETPPGHWNVLANDVSDELAGFEPRIGGVGSGARRAPVGREAVPRAQRRRARRGHRRVGPKRHYDSVRPISMIRYIGGLGQSPDPPARRTTATACRSCPA